MDLPQKEPRLRIPRLLLLGLSFVSLAICTGGGTAHYLKHAWGDPWQPIGWLLSMFFLLCAFLPDPRDLATGFKSLIKPKTAFFLFWILFFVVSHLWNFRTAPWNGDALFDESGNDLGYLKSHVIGHPYQAAWFHGIISRETLFHYYVWGFLKLFGFNRTVAWSSLAVIVYSFLAAATPILLYIVFNREPYTYYEGRYIHQFWDAVRGTPAPNDMRYYVTGLWNCFFAAHFWPRLLFPDFLPIPLPYYWLLLPGFVLALWQKRFEVVLLATLPVVGVFVTGGVAVEQRLLLAIPFWIILMSFTLARLLKLRSWPGVQILLGVLAGLILLKGLGPSIRYIYSKTKSPLSIHHYAQHQVAVSRFLKHVVAGQQHPEPPRLERDEFNRIKGIPDAPYETLICQNDAYSIIHLFLHDYDDGKILSFCSELPFFGVMSELDVWNANKKAILSYVPGNKDLKLIWERDPKTERIITMFQSLRDFGTEDTISFSFGGRLRTFYVLNIGNKNIRQFLNRVRALPATPGAPPPQFSSLPENATTMFEGSRGTDEGQFDSPMGIAVDANGNILVADTNNGRIEKFSPTGTFLSIIGTKGSGHGQLGEPNGIAIDRAGNIYVAEVAHNHRVQKLARDGTFIAEWKGPELGFYGPRRIAIGPDDSIYVVDQGHARIVKFSSDGRVLAVWGSSGNGDGQFNDPYSLGVDAMINAG